MFLAQVTLPSDSPLSGGRRLVRLMGGLALGFPGQGHFHCQLDALGVAYYRDICIISFIPLKHFILADCYLKVISK